MPIKIRKVRLFVVASILLTFSMYLFLNVMVVELNSNNREPSGEDNDKPIYNLNDQVREVRETRKKSRIINEFHVDAGSRVQRKPQTTNLDGDDVDNSNGKVEGVNYDISNPGLKKTADNINQNNEHNLAALEVKPKEDNQETDVNDREAEEYEDEDDNMEENQEEDLDDADLEDEDEDSYEEEVNDNPNRVFKPGDFGDIRGLEYHRKSKLDVEEVPAEVRDNKPDSSLVHGKIFWSPVVEALVPKGKSYLNITQLVKYLRQQEVVTLIKPQWNKCGRPKNAIVTLTDSTEMCARYRHPKNFFVYGEALSFYLSRLLSMDNVPTVFLSKVNSSSSQWSGRDLNFVGWEENSTVALIQLVDDLTGVNSRVYIPPLLLQAYWSGHPLTASNVSKYGNDSTQLSYLVQWGSMIIFDYLTGNYDRVASMQDAAEKKPAVMTEHIRNLRQSTNDNKLWLIDNESGFFDAYELLKYYLHQVGEPRFVKFHRDMLQSMCVFQSSMVVALRQLASSPTPHLRLWNFATSFEPLLEQMPTQGKEFQLFSVLFPKRLKEVLVWIDHCSHLS